MNIFPFVLFLILALTFFIQTGISPCSDIPEDVESIQDFATVKDLSDVNFPITSEGFLKLLNTVAPKYLKKVSEHDSWGISRNFSGTTDYDHPRYWNNPLESQVQIIFTTYFIISVYLSNISSQMHQT